MLRITVLVGEWERLEPIEGKTLSYLMWDVYNAWERMGHEVRVCCGVPDGGASGGPDAEPWDVCVLHVDLTRTPAEYVEFANTHRVVINGDFLDNSKRVVSRQLVAPDDGYEGAVIVKSDLNYGGSPERTRARGSGSWLSRQLASARRRLPWWMWESLPAREYRVFEKRAEVPRGVWRNRGLVVEKYLPEFHDGYYWVRMWLFLGDRGYVRQLGSTNPVSKTMHMKVQRQGSQDDPELLPEAVRVRRRELGVDFGKIDYVVHNGEVIVFDVNRTPNSAKKGPEEKRRQAEVLASGLEELVEAEGLIGSGGLAC